MKATKNIFNGLFLAICLITQPLSAQTNIFSISEIDSLMNRKEKPILIMLSTDWCQYCKVQKKQLDKNNYFQSQSDRFYFTEFDAESVEPVIFQGKNFVNESKKKTKQIHPLAAYLLKEGQQAYPVWILLDHNYNELFRYNGLLKPEQINAVIKPLE